MRRRSTVLNSTQVVHFQGLRAFFVQVCRDGKNAALKICPFSPTLSLNRDLMKTLQSSLICAAPGRTSKVVGHSIS
jgi:hypothetical protein